MVRSRASKKKETEAQQGRAKMEENTRTEVEEVETSGSAAAKVNHDDDMNDIRRDIETKCNALQAFTEDAALALRSELKVQLLKMPKKVRNMPLKDFLSKFAGDINEVIVDELNARFISIENTSNDNVPMTTRRGQRARGAATTCKKATRAPATVMRTTRKRARELSNLTSEDSAQVACGTVLRSTRSRTRSMSIANQQLENVNSPNPRLLMKTPAPATTRRSTRQPFTPLVSNASSAAALGELPPNTVARNPKRGEVFFSKNGSPLGVCAEEVGSPCGSNENVHVMMTPMVGGTKNTKQWTAAKSAIKTCATVRCRTRSMKMIQEDEEGKSEREIATTKTAATDNTPLSPEDLQILLTNEDGEEINLQDCEDNENLPVDIKSLALGKLMGLQNKVMSMIASLGQ